MREKMLLIADRIEQAAKDAGGNLIGYGGGKRALAILVTAIREELGGPYPKMTPPSLSEEMTPEDPNALDELWGLRAPVLSNAKEEGTEAPYANMMAVSGEQQARDLLDRIGVENAQMYSSEDLGELSNLIIYAITKERRNTE